ncbi:MULTISPECIES: conserved phage C-terminal domain-containing protein [unclassified Clostridioides]|uniref:conserved phage C-terminal domain-containing protein n=1 Tax=unclassified Clostridioides TaxID=2635829 RepID=UPI001D1094BE|nr:conserved phage C-terminal domain-containing protein [Clostridioides sp. ES-S-0056-01]MCC0713865.1 conserved phage C-terminal domain-containing protein [Clostridioides sp. ES-S-0077-01]
MNNGFYKLNSVVLGFDIRNDINKIRFNHYIMRKENVQRLQGTLPRGQFYMTVRRTSTDLQLSISTISRLVKEFLDLGIIRLVSKGVKGNRSVYSYVSIELNGSLFDDNRCMELDCVDNGDCVDGNDIESDYVGNGDCLDSSDIESDCIGNVDCVDSSDIEFSSINTNQNYINESFDVRKLKEENSNPQSESINLNFNDTHNDIYKRTNNSMENSQNKKVMKLSNSKLYSDISVKSQKNTFNDTHDMQKKTKCVTKKKESLNKINKKNIQQSIINMLNKKSGKNFKINSPISIKLINERLREGYVLEDFYKVIEVKVAKWKDTIMEMYIRPETLFSYKFESYVNENISIKSQSNVYQYREGNNRDSSNYIHSDCATYDDSVCERKKHENVRYWNPICEL